MPSVQIRDSDRQLLPQGTEALAYAVTRSPSLIDSSHGRSHESATALPQLPDPSHAQELEVHPTPSAVHNGDGELSSAKATIGAHAPSARDVRSLLHDLQVVSHAPLQQTPSTQWALAH